MRALIQRVTRASVTVHPDAEGDQNGVPELSGAIGPGLCVFVGVTHSDGDVEAKKLADKIMHLRILEGETSVLTAGAEVLVVSQFTLYGETAKGRRPGWSAAAKPEHAEPLVDAVVQHLRDAGLTVATGRFRTNMMVDLVNHGPITLMVEV